MCITSFCIVVGNFLLGKQIYFFSLVLHPSWKSEDRNLGQVWVKTGSAERSRGFHQKGETAASNLRSKVDHEQAAEAGFKGEDPVDRNESPGLGRSWGNSLEKARWERICPKRVVGFLSYICNSHLVLLILIPCLKKGFWASSCYYRPLGLKIQEREYKKPS